MPKLNRDEYFARLTEYVGDDSSDRAISFIEDMTDTYTALEEVTLPNDGIDWKKRYEENDLAWRNKYKSRFFGGTAGNYTDTVVDETTLLPKPTTFDDIFEEKKED